MAYHSQFGVNTSPFGAYNSMGRMINDMDGLSNVLATQSQVTASAVHAHDNAYTYKNQRSPWPGNSDKLFPMAGTAAWNGRSGVTSVLTGMSAQAGGISSRMLTSDEELAAIAAIVAPIGVVRNAEVYKGGKLNRLITLVIGGTCPIVVPPGTGAFELLVWDLPPPGTETKTLAADVPNTAHAALIATPARKTNRARVRLAVHQLVAATGGRYGAEYGRAAASLAEERDADFTFALNGGLALLRVLSDLGLQLTNGPRTGENGDPAPPPRGVDPIGADLMARADSTEQFLDDLFALIGPSTPGQAPTRVQQYVQTALMPRVYGTLSDDTLLGTQVEAYRTRVGAGSNRLKRVRFQQSAARDMYTVRAVQACAFKAEAKAFTLAPADANGNTTAVIVR